MEPRAMTFQDLGLGLFVPLCDRLGRWCLYAAGGSLCSSDQNNSWLMIVGASIPWPITDYINIFYYIFILWANFMGILLPTKPKGMTLRVLNSAPCRWLETRRCGMEATSSAPQDVLSAARPQPVVAWGTNPMVNYEPFMSFDNREYFGNIVRSCLDAPRHAPWTKPVAQNRGMLRELWDWLDCSWGFLSMIQVITNAQWANHIGRPVILQYPALASWLTEVPKKCSPEYRTRTTYLYHLISQYFAFKYVWSFFSLWRLSCSCGICGSLAALSSSSSPSSCCQRPLACWPPSSRISCRTPWSHLGPSRKLSRKLIVRIVPWWRLLGCVLGQFRHGIHNMYVYI